MSITQKSEADTTWRGVIDAPSLSEIESSVYHNLVSFTLYLTDVCPSTGNSYVQSQITALQTGLEHNRRIMLQSNLRGQLGHCVLLSDVTKSHAFMSLYCGCTSWAGQGTEKWGKNRVGIYNENHAFDLSGWGHSLNLIGFKDGKIRFSPLRA